MFIFLYGSDTFRSNEKLSSIKNKFLEKDSSGSGLSFLDYGEKEVTVQQLKNLLSSQGLFSTKKLIIVKNAIGGQLPEKQKELLALLKTNTCLAMDTEIVLIFFEAGSPKKNGALYKFLFASAKRQEFTALEGLKLSSWALAYLKEINPIKTIDRRALELLTASTGSDLYLLSNEISKLANYKNANEVITLADVQLLVKSRIDSTIFQAIEALSSGNKVRTLTLLHQQIENGEDIFYLLSMYTYHIRTLLKIGDCFWKGLTAPAQIAQATKLHPYVIQKSLSQLRNLSEDKVKNILKSLAEIDYNAKTGKINPVQALDTFIVSL
ncbi:MAG: DNA polymerase III subunit delta [Candidatus Moranbacteria bacterium]|nr:DNA polymerase III subunit delta [Candidatus Moranbacteria bacterium]